MCECAHIRISNCVRMSMRVCVSVLVCLVCVYACVRARASARACVCVVSVFSVGLNELQTPVAEHFGEVTVFSAGLFAFLVEH